MIKDKINQVIKEVYALVLKNNIDVKDISVLLEEDGWSAKAGFGHFFRDYMQKQHASMSVTEYFELMRLKHAKDI